MKCNRQSGRQNGDKKRNMPRLNRPKSNSGQEYYFYVKLDKERIKIRQEVKYRRLQVPNKKHTVYDYPACIAACSDGKNITKVYISRSARCTSNFYNNCSLDQPIKKIGPVGSLIKTKGRACNSRVGYCAEPHAARELLLNTNIHRTKIVFSDVIRPRTSKIIKSCQICKQLFPQL